VKKRCPVKYFGRSRSKSEEDLLPRKHKAEKNQKEKRNLIKMPGKRRIRKTSFNWGINALDSKRDKGRRLTEEGRMGD